ncbi:MAG: crossover junction endodeoxyribonuclease RuvC [Thiohalobacteraceae bacterium]|nr:crossover junction endodeoxyribonuclease RuvC [Gammaproteobacteria bacterium]
MRILGIDPGSQITGFGIIDVDGPCCRHLHSGHIKVDGAALPEKLGVIFSAVQALVAEWRPQELAIERVFMARNADSALKLGQARGAAICAAVGTVPTIAEYSPSEVKQAIVGKGGATKEQIQHMVRVLLKLTTQLQPDQADALAIALCHSHMRQTLSRIPGARAARGGRFR